MDAVEVNRHLHHSLRQQIHGFGLLRHATLLQRQRQLLDFFGEQRRAIEFDHLQAAMHLVHTAQALNH